mmetsp:Transcript_82910/g.251409  ORF Transcript_82910/g.251409 Transcript_82910/m.251409 type:complete len:376 (-) Transcript_82910:220-1347(-)
MGLAHACHRRALALLVAGLLTLATRGAPTAGHAESMAPVAAGAGTDACVPGSAGPPSCANVRGGRESTGAVAGSQPGVVLLQQQYSAERSGGKGAGSAAQWPWPQWPAPPAQAPATPPADGVAVKLMTFNVYYKDLDHLDRVEGISTAIATMDADIAVITEQWSWNGKARILEEVRRKSGRDYRIAEGGDFQDRTWDGDVMYDAQQWEVLADGVQDLGSERGLTWASMRHKASGKGLLVYGVHPLCCGNEDAHLQNALDFAAHLGSRPERPATPAVIMGDFNAFEDWSSTRLYKGETVWAYDRFWSLPVAFDDAFRVPPSNQDIDGGTFHNGVRFDYIFTERRQPPAFFVQNASIWRSAPGGSDHHPLMATVVLS